MKKKKKNKKKSNWNNILWNTLKVLLVIILNTPLWVYLIGSFVPYGTIGEFRLSWIDYLKLSDNIAWYHIWILYIFIPIGIMLSVGFIKWLISEGKKEKRHKEMIEENKKNMEQLINLQKEKEEKKIEKEINKYL